MTYKTTYEKLRRRSIDPYAQANRDTGSAGSGERRSSGRAGADASYSWAAPANDIQRDPQPIPHTPSRQRLVLDTARNSSSISRRAPLSTLPNFGSSNVNFLATPKQRKESQFVGNHNVRGHSMYIGR
ncbi:hypothetical protein MRB53_039075 [Persea americana]|nr:hypothetical protein MRB53_039075 [Persea americana]